MKSTVIVWFRQDLRLDDNPALLAAVESGSSVIPVYIWSPEEEGKWSPGSASRYWLHHALKNLDDDLQVKSSKLILLRGPCLEALQMVIKTCSAKKLYWNRCYEPRAIKRDRFIKQTMTGQGIEVRDFNAHLLHEPHTIQNKQGGPFKVYTPFWKHYQNLDVPVPVKTPKQILSPQKWPKSVPVNDFGFIPNIKWYGMINDTWEMSCQGAKKSIRKFIKNQVHSYSERRNFPANNGVSRISPYLHFGQISARSIWHMIYSYEQRQGRITPDKAVVTYLKQLVWREFASHLLYHFPYTTDQPLYEKYKKFPWHRNRKFLTAWQQGQSGYPIVDAGMRELWHTGWMHNRVRMIVASFLTKDLLIHWHQGAEWFWDTLVDADLANNTLGWQWVAGCGADAAPYYRIFNPVTQGERFDPEGEYVRRWLPELSGLDNKYIHKPWEATNSILSGANIRLGKSYPYPIVNHAEARKQALSYYQKIRN